MMNYLSGAEILNPQSGDDERERVPQAADAGPPLALQPDHCLRCHPRPGTPPPYAAFNCPKNGPANGIMALIELSSDPN